ncbi:MAG: hypothetical protein ACXABY_08885 [Candidatus Thorarchaeota archaeon]|jgi:hypothetical protein
MSEVARQYNLIGETLRQGIGDLLKGQAAGKALDIQAAEMGVRSEQQKSQALRQERSYKMELKRFEENQRQFDENAKRQDRANKLQVTKDEYRMKNWNQQATRHTMGARTPWIRDLIVEKFEPQLAQKLGITHGDKGYERNGKPMSQGELWSDPDVVALFKANMELDDILPHQIKYEQEELAALKESMANDDSIDEATKKQVIEQQQKTIDMHIDQLRDKEAYPVKYLNARIDGIFQIMQNSPNADILAKELEHLTAERDFLLKRQIAEGKFRSKDFFKKTYYGPDGSEKDRWLPKESPKAIDQMDATMEKLGYSTAKNVAKFQLGPENKEGLVDRITKLRREFEAVKAGGGISDVALTMATPEQLAKLRENADTDETLAWIAKKIDYYSKLEGLPAKYNSKDAEAIARKLGLPVEEIWERVFAAEYGGSQPEERHLQ